MAVPEMKAGGKGPGSRALVRGFEAQMPARGGPTVWLDSDDQDDLTSPTSVEWFPNVCDRLHSTRNLMGRPSPVV